jgi:hypothetical protein
LCRRFNSAPSHHLYKWLTPSDFPTFRHFRYNRSQTWSQTGVQFRNGKAGTPLYNSRMRLRAVVRKFWWLGIAPLGLVVFVVFNQNFKLDETSFSQKYL